MAAFFNRLMDNLRKGPVGPVIRWADDHPRLAMWIVLGVGMVAILIPESLKVNMEWYQRGVLVIATLLTAGACVWIITWEDEDEVEGEAVPVKPAQAEAKADTTAASAPAGKKGTGKLAGKGAGKLAEKEPAKPAKKGTGRLSKKK
jgi:hypothetical protein